MGICKPITGGFIFFKTADIVKNNEEVDLQGQALTVQCSCSDNSSWESVPCGYEQE